MSSNWPWQRIPGVDVGGGRWVGTEVSERFPIYTRGNAGEVYPEVYRPLTFSIAQRATEQAMRRAILTSGLIRPEELDDIPMTAAIGSGVFGGYAYLNLSIQRLASARVPGGSATDADTSFLGVGEPPPHIPLPNERNVRASLAGVRYLWKLTGQTECPRLDRDADDQARYLSSLPDPAAATDDELRAGTTNELIERFANWFETHLVISFGAGSLMSLLATICDKQLGDASIAVRLMSGLGGVDSAAPSAAMWTLARRTADSASLTAAFGEGVAGLSDRIGELAAHGDEDAAAFESAFAEFIDEYGSRGPNEWDTAFDTWGTDPALALTLIDRMRLTDDSHAPEAQRVRLAAERERLEAEVMAKLSRPLRPLLRRVLRAARLHMQWRERAKTNIVRAIHGGRLSAQELDRRLAERSGGSRGDLWFLLDDEIDEYIAEPRAMLDTIAERRAVLAELECRIPPFFFEGELPPIDTWECRTAPLEQLGVGASITGLPGCAGTARGRARVVTDPGDPRGLEPGDVLIAPLTDPSWTPLFVPAEAVVVDVGAAMSHAVIVSRELGIPCAVSVTNATRRIPDGALVDVDGSAGTVTVVDLPRAAS